MSEAGRCERYARLRKTAAPPIVARPAAASTTTSHVLLEPPGEPSPVRGSVVLGAAPAARVAVETACVATTVLVFIGVDEGTSVPVGVAVFV